MTANRLLAKAMNKLGHQYALGLLRLPLIYYGYLLNHPEPELTQLATFLRGRRMALDVGANIGLWSYKLARLFTHVHSFKPNSDSHTFREGCGHWSITLTMKTVQKYSLFGQSQQRSVEVNPPDSYGFSDSDLIKTDAAGHERAVVEDDLDTIRRNRPVIVIETSPERLPALHELLGPLGYRATSLRSGPTDNDQNFLFIPE